MRGSHVSIYFVTALAIICSACGSPTEESLGFVQQAATFIKHSTFVINGAPDYNSGWSTSPAVSWPTAVSDFGNGDADDAIVSFTPGSFAEVHSTVWNLVPGEYQKITQILGMDAYFDCHADSQIAELEMYFITNHQRTPIDPPDQYLTIKNCPVWPLQAMGHRSFSKRPDGTAIDKSDFLALRVGQGFTFERSGPPGWLRVDGVVLDITQVEIF